MAGVGIRRSPAKPHIVRGANGTKASVGPVSLANAEALRQAAEDAATAAEGYRDETSAISGLDDVEGAVDLYLPGQIGDTGTPVGGALSATIDDTTAANSTDTGTSLGAALLAAFAALDGTKRTVRSVGDGKEGALNWLLDADSGFNLHLTTGTNSTGSAATIGIGTDKGTGAGLLVSHKNGGLGLWLVGNPGAGITEFLANFSSSFASVTEVYTGAGPRVTQAKTGAGFADGVTRNGKTTLASATAVFTAADVGGTLAQLTTRALDDPTGCIPTGATVSAVVDTTVAAGSNGATLPQATISLASTTGLPTGGGSIAIASSSGVQIVTYGGVSGSTITGCSGGVGTLSTGGAAKTAVMSAAAGASGTAILFRLAGTGIRVPATTQQLRKNLDTAGATLLRETIAGLEVFGGDVAVAPLRVTGASGHTGNVAEVLLSGNGTPALAVQSTGRTRQQFSALISNAGLTTQNALVVQSFSTSTSTLYVQAHSAQGGDQVTLVDSGSVTQFRFNKAGYPITKKTAAPADADLGSSELTQWHDPTNGAAKAMFKGKEAGGTVRSISLPLSPVTLAAAATDAATTQTLVNDLRAKLIATGMYA